MHRKIGWYLTELESRLRGRMPAEEVDRFLDETEDHLCASAEDLEAEGTSCPAEEAIKRFGRPSTVARRALLARFTPPPYWRAAALPMALVVVVVASLAAWNSFDNVLVLGAPLPQVVAVGMVLPLLIALARARQRVTAALAIAMVIASIGAAVILSTTMVDVLVPSPDRGTQVMMGMPVRGIAKNLTAIQASVQRNQRFSESVFSDAEKQFGDAFSTYSGDGGTNPFKVPIGYASDWTGFGTIEVRAFKTLPEAMVAWRQQGRRAMQRWQAADGFHEALVSGVRRELARPWAARFGDSLMGSFLPCVQFLLILVAVNEFTLLVGNGLRFRRRREYT